MNRLTLRRFLYLSIFAASTLGLGHTAHAAAAPEASRPVSHTALTAVQPEPAHWVYRHHHRHWVADRRRRHRH